jgi:DNA-3-methyladenine glycosylase
MAVRPRRLERSFYERPAELVAGSPIGKIFSYGVNYLANAVCAPVGVSGVLIRALEPLTGVPLMRANRGHPNVSDSRPCSGPGRLCKAFGLTRADNDTDIVFGKVRILDYHFALPYARGGRVGISVGQDLDWRFYVEGHPSVSVPPVPMERGRTMPSPVLKTRSSSH